LRASALALWRDARAAITTVAGYVATRRRPRRQLALRMVVEATPCADSRVTLTGRRDAFGMPRPRVNWRINESDWLGVTRFRDTLARAIETNGLGKLLDDRGLNAEGWPVSMMGGKHHMGTTRMHADPARGVVDPVSKVHSVANLYVAGSSVFPTCGWANPTFTILALSIRLADHLKRAI
ncbi:MAG: GMC family oxidoreductase, partial [Paracoccaceae bacterium]|nr:GMC family oxidoreductase [Paracoccaceae bacterium]